jgi:glucose/arabinose dehydrogenase
MRLLSLLLFLSILLLASAIATAQPDTEDLALRRAPLEIPVRLESLYTGIDSVWLPENFRIEVFHAGLQQPRFMAWSPGGVLHVADMEGHRIVALPDRDFDGVADTAITVAAPVDTAHSLAFHNGALYVAEPSRVLRFRDVDGDGLYESREIFIGGIHSTGVYNHFTRTILFDEPRGRIFLGVGASCNACREENPERGTIMRFDIDGSNRMIYATGLRNPIGLAIEPATGELWTTNADRDWLGDDVPPEIVTHVDSGSFHGWPFAYGDRKYVDFTVEAPEYRALLPITPADQGKVLSMQVADLTLPAHSTPMGITFLDVEKLPSSWRGSALVAVHGSSPNGRPGGAVGYNVVRIRYDSTLGRWVSGVFLSGFLIDTLAYRCWGRPCGITVDTAGDIYLSSDRGIGAIYKISYTPPPVRVPLPTTSSALRVQAMPNPSRGEVSLIYHLPEAGTVSFRIYDHLGRIIMTTTQGAQSSGSHRTALMGALGPGAYRVEITIENTRGEYSRESSGFVVEGN